MPWGAWVEAEARAVKEGGMESGGKSHSSCTYNAGSSLLDCSHTSLSIAQFLQCHPHRNSNIGPAAEGPAASPVVAMAKATEGVRVANEATVRRAVSVGAAETMAVAEPEASMAVAVTLCSTSMPYTYTSSSFAQGWKRRIPGTSRR